MESELGYERNELIGNSITTLMHPNIAQHHNEYVKKFFTTMEASNIGIERFKFFKKKNCFYAPCRTLLKIVPRLSNGLQIVIFLIVDPEIRTYSSIKKNKAFSSVFYIL